MAKATGRPVAVTCTSGTAAANLHPAVVEAWRGARAADRADGRPPARAARGRRRASRSTRSSSTAARSKWFVEVGTHEPGRETAVHHRALACRAYWTAAGGRPGPGAPQLPAARAARARAASRSTRADWAGRPDGRPWTELREHASAPHADDVQQLAARIAADAARRDRLRADRRAGGRARRAAGRRSAAGRCSPSRPRACAAAPTTARTWSPTTTCCCASSASPPATRPGWSLRVGDMPTSKPLRAWVAGRAAGGARPARRLARADPPGRAAAPSRRRAGARRAGRRDRDARAPSATRPGSRRGAPPTPWCPPALAEAPDRFEPKVLAALEPELPGRRDRLAQLVDAGPRRRGLLPAVAQAAALPRQPRRQRHRRRRLVGRRGGARERPPDLAADRRAGAAARRRRPARGAPRPARDLQIVCLNNGGGGDLRLPAGGRARRRRGSTRSTSPRRPRRTSTPWPPRSARGAHRPARRTSSCTAQLVERVARAASA